ncbi:hypothetical protein PHYSODRAFT_505874 [Phytophthora sojae]|uniref:SWIM-type domain-containing protein n=1 Tax=Phytophthora sojae (strain P6497) TaxID=1094619 RepID=G4ZKF6_PHYSP|nr:hypothetical protein PHYSODRAFT_505874 [Phytophthora sojae]EGZ15566.1 hypothetical protein PHYSODRAFT_505874 [Phytophthora sojae]|eukprot:XP_009529315.1 hypothetical protein PHYSODRAFT_505874 [Phytophthora sojae]
MRYANGPLQNILCLSVLFRKVLNLANLKRFSVDIDLLECEGCSTRVHKLIPCAHLIVAIYTRNKQDNNFSIHSALKDAFHQAYITPSYNAAFSDVGISIHTDTELTRESLIRSPPRYRQAGGSLGSVAHLGQDRLRAEKQIKSRGELPTGLGSVSSPTTYDSATSDLIAVMSEAISGVIMKKRSKYKCSTCKKTGHNKRRFVNETERPNMQRSKTWELRSEQNH